MIGASVTYIYRCAIRNLKQADRIVYSREFPFRIAAGVQIIFSQVSRGFS
jgi:hypothetical protein